MGECDLSVDVDFGLVGMGAEGLLDCYGPIEQGAFLERMGIYKRLEGICKGLNDTESAALKSGVDRVVKDMGVIYKVLVMQNKGCGVPYAFQPIDKIIEIADKTDEKVE